MSDKSESILDMPKFERSDLKIIEAKLIENGYSGLCVDGVFGSCGCHIGDLAPCGECIREGGEEYINSCEPGFKFCDPADPSSWIVKPENIAPTQEDWVKINRGFY